MDEELKRLFSDLNLVEYIALLESKSEKKQIGTSEHIIQNEEKMHVEETVKEDSVSLPTAPVLLQPVVQLPLFEGIQDLKSDKIDSQIYYKEETKGSSWVRQFFCLLAFFCFGFAGGILYERAYMPLPIKQQKMQTVSQDQNLNKELSKNE